MIFLMSHRLTIRLSDSDFEKVSHWAEKEGKSISEFMAEAATFRMNWLCADYPLAPLEVQRLNQLLDIVTGLSHNIQSLERVTTSGFDSLLGLTRGDSYLLDEDGSDV